MQEIKTRAGETITEFFDGINDSDVWDKMRARFKEQEQEHDIVSLKRCEVSKNQMKRLRRKERGK